MQVSSKRGNGNDSHLRVHQPQGGVGKSTSATNTAVGIASMLRRAGASNARVLLIDTDSQSHATLVTTGTKDFGADAIYTYLLIFQ
ncbi:MAG: AAA family ATPase [Anaerolineaceae bacterium]|nr:AAA family ATPase [Anaerolineaceae bacterium]